MHLVLEDIHKYFGPVRANEGIGLDIRPGAILGVLGENGAGKSTLMKILSGYLPRTKGTIRVDGKEVECETPEAACRLGIGMLYQDPLDFPCLCVLENFMAGQGRGFFGGRKHYRNRLAEQAARFGFSLDPDRPVWILSVGERQQLELLRLFSMGVSVLILDEPTTGISGVQKEVLFQAIRKLAAEGKSVILVSHKLEDVESLCHKVVVLRQGKVAGRMDAPFDTPALLEMMFGSLPAPPRRPENEPGDSLLEMIDIEGSGGRTGLGSCRVHIRKKEVVGLAGLEGSGQGVFLRIAAGLEKPRKGELRISGKKKEKHRPGFADSQVTFLPASRLEEGLIRGLSIREHFALLENSGGFFVGGRTSEKTAAKKILDFRIKGGVDSPVESLSGGNQQRLLLSFLPEKPDLLLLENPTRGLDVESAHWVWEQLLAYREHGTGIVFSSAELDEILMVADRILVFFEGAIIKDVRASETDMEELGRAIAGKS